jgi:hypothetical protein
VAREAGLSMGSLRHYFATQSELEAGRLHALVDGLAVHATMHSAKLPPAQVVAILARHLDSLEPRP